MAPWNKKLYGGQWGSLCRLTLDDDGDGNRKGGTNLYTVTCTRWAKSWKNRTNIERIKQQDEPHWPVFSIESRVAKQSGRARRTGNRPTRTREKNTGVTNTRIQYVSSRLVGGPRSQSRRSEIPNSSKFSYFTLPPHLLSSTRLLPIRDRNG